LTSRSCGPSTTTPVNVIRKNMVLDPRWYEYSDRVAALRNGGTRRVYYRVAFPRRDPALRDLPHPTGRGARRSRRPRDRLPTGRAVHPRGDVLTGGLEPVDAPAQVVWEHAFTSPEAYQRYMAHPFHANVLDRYLLNDSPQRVVVDNDLGAGLVGYHCTGPVFELASGIRRIVLLTRRPPGVAR